MGKTFWTPAIAIACVIWGTAILIEQHHLSNLVPLLGSYLLAFGLSLGAVYTRHGRKG